MKKSVEAFKSNHAGQTRVPYSNVTSMSQEGRLYACKSITFRPSSGGLRDFKMHFLPLPPVGAGNVLTTVYLSVNNNSKSYGWTS